jgi:hypothetical protein
VKSLKSDLCNFIPKVDDSFLSFLQNTWVITHEIVYVYNIALPLLYLYNHRFNRNKQSEYVVLLSAYGSFLSVGSIGTIQ